MPDVDAMKNGDAGPPAKKSKSDELNESKATLGDDSKDYDIETQKVPSYLV